MKKVILFLIILVFSICNCFLSEASKIREPAVSNTFYPANSIVLSEQIDAYLNKAKPQDVDGELIALILPHAGYIYSGHVAAYGYNLLKYRNFDTVIVIGPSHHVYFNGISVYNGDFYKTPLGNVPINKKMTNFLIKNSKKVSFYEAAHKKEHSVEVQIPFLQKTLFDFKLVAIVTGDMSYEEIKEFAYLLSSLIKKQNKKVLIIASTDLSHYHNYDTACKLDHEAIRILKTLNPELLIEKFTNKEIELCGLKPVIIAEIASCNLGANKVEVLKYANSGDVTFARDRVVGYTSLSILNYKGGKGNMLSEKQKKRLIEIARESIKSVLKGKKIPSFDTDDEELRRENGAFVTLKINNNLRGCIGHIVADSPLYKTISEMAVQSAFGDPRFPKLKKEELERIEIEISVLSKLKKIDDVKEIEVGKHGLLMRKGFYSGLLLPQVATEYGWDRKTFLEHTCQKAGLPKDTWRDKDTEIYIFTAEVFSESELKDE